MLYYYKIYAKVECPFCVQAINKMNEHGFDHSLTLVDKSTDYFESIKKKYDHHTVPIILKVPKADTYGNIYEVIGGYDDFMKMLILEGYEEQC